MMNELELHKAWKDVTTSAMQLIEINKALYEENKRLKCIINKAIEFIYENAYDVERENCIDDLWGEIPKLLEILKENDKE